MKNIALITSGIIFLIVGVGQLSRYFLKISITADLTHVINRVYNFPLEVSLYIGIAALLLSVWMFMAAAKDNR